MKKIKVDAGKCIGCTSCSTICSSVVAMQDGKAVVIGKANGEEENVKLAKEACPTAAISIEE